MPSQSSASAHPATDGRLGRLGRWAATHRRAVVLAWVGVAVCLGVLAPRAEHALSGGGWQADGSESVEARRADRPGLRRAGQLCARRGRQLADAATARARPSARPSAAWCGLLRRDPAVGAVRSPRPGESIAPNGRVAVVRGGAAAGTAEMVRAADSPARSLRGGRGAGSRGLADRLGGPVVGVQRGEQGRDAALGGDVLAGHAGGARRRLRLARRGRDPAAARDPGAGRHRRRALDRSAVHRHHDLGDELRADVRARGGDRLRALRRGSIPWRAASGPPPG